MAGGDQVVLTGGSGRTLTSLLLNARFFEYTEVYYLGLKFEPPPPPHGVYPLEAGHLYLPRYTGVEPVKESWIYVFSLRPTRKAPGRYVAIAAEIWADKDGKYQAVAWGQDTRDQYTQLDERPKLRPKSTARFEWGDEIYACESRVPFSADRLRQYMRSLDLVKNRCQKIKVSDLKEDPDQKNTHQIFLINHVEVLQGLRNKYHDALDEYNSEIGDKAKAEKRLLASLTISAVDSYSQSKQRLKIDTTQLDWSVREDQWKLNKDAFIAKDKKEWWGGRLGSGMEERVFAEMRSDWWSAGKQAKEEWVQIEGGLTEDLYQSKAGRNHFEWIADQRENLFEELVNEHEGGGELAISLSRAGAETSSKAVDYLVNFALLKMGTTNRIMKLLEYYLPNTFLLLDIPLEEVGVTFIENKKVIRGMLDKYKGTLYELDLKYDFKEIDVSERFIKSKALPKLALFINVINFVFQMDELQHKKSGLQTYAQIAAIGAAASSTAATLGEIYAEEETRAAAALKVVGVAAAILEAISSGLKAYDALQKRKEDLAIAYGITATASLMMIASIENPLFFVGLFLFVVGSFLVTVFTTTELEDWFNSCTWGKDFKGEASNPASRQLRELLILIGRPKIEFQLSAKDGKTKVSDKSQAEYLSLVVHPTICFLPETQFKISFSLYYFESITSRGDLYITDDRFKDDVVELPDQESFIIYGKEGSVDQIVRNWRLSSADLVKRAPNHLSYNIWPKFLSSWGEFAEEDYHEVKEIGFMS